MRLACCSFLAVCLAATVAFADSPRRMAVVVGADKAAPGRSPLHFSYDDARSVARVLVDVGGFRTEDVIVLLDPSPDSVLAKLSDVRRALATAKGETMLLFYYSGHADVSALYPNGEPLRFADLKDQLDDPSVTVRVGIVDACRGGGWTGAKGMTAVTPFEVTAPMTLANEGSVLVSSSSGLEDAHESSAIGGSFFTYHLVAGLRGAADRSGDGEVTLTEAFDYAKTRTIHDSALQAPTLQSPSYQVNLRGTRDLALTRIDRGAFRVHVTQTEGPLELIQLETGLVVMELQKGERQATVALPAGRYLVRRRGTTGIAAREIELGAGTVVEVREEQLEIASPELLAAKATDGVSSLPFTLPRHRFQIRLAFSAPFWGSSGNLPFSAAHYFAPGLAPFNTEDGNSIYAGTAQVFFGLTDRVQLSLLTPGIAVRLGNPQFIEWLVWGGLNSIYGYWLNPTPYSYYGTTARNMNGADWAFGGGVDFRIHGGPNWAMQVSLMTLWVYTNGCSGGDCQPYEISAFSGFTSDTQAVVNPVIAVTYVARFGIVSIAPSIGYDPVNQVFSVGAKPGTGQAPLPLVQVALGRHLSLDANVVGLIVMKSDALQAAGAATMATVGVSIFP